MIRFFRKRGRWAALYSFVLCAAFAFVLLDTFVIPKAMVQAQPAAPAGESAVVASVPEEGASAPADAQSTAQKGQPVITDTSYEDENISIRIETLRAYDTTLYVADIQLQDAAYLKTALAQNTYGRNIKDTTSDIAAQNNAIFAINGDYYGFRDAGIVLRNGTLYRDVAADKEALLIDAEGDFAFEQESKIDTAALLEAGVQQVLSFGPVLVQGGQVAVDAGSEVSQSKTSNPRTAIGQVDALHYIVIVSDGRTSESTGLSLLQLAEQFALHGCVAAYNLDGGGSSTMVFNGQVVNTTTDGKSDGERRVSDIVYIGYE